MTDDSGDLGLTTGADLAIQALNQIETASPELPSPAQVTNASLPVDVTSERRDRERGGSDEATHSVGVQTQKERDEKVVSVPECLEGLLSNASVGSGVHEKHAQEHDVTSNASSFSVVDLQCRHGSNLRLLDVVEAMVGQLWLEVRATKRCHSLDVMGRDVDAGEEEHGVSDLAMEPQVLIQRQLLELGSNPSHDRAAYWQQDDHAVH